MKTRGFVQSIAALALMATQPQVDVIAHVTEADAKALQGKKSTRPPRGSSMTPHQGKREMERRARRLSS